MRKRAFPVALAAIRFHEGRWSFHKDGLLEPASEAIAIPRFRTIAYTLLCSSQPENPEGAQSEMPSR